MRKHRFVLPFIVVALAVALAGCSADNPASPVDDGGAALANQSSSMCHIYGNAFKIDGSYAVGVTVSIYVGYNGVFNKIDTVTTGEYGSFSTDHYLSDGAQVRCAGVGDVQTKDWLGGAYCYIALHQQRNFHIIDDPYQVP